MRITPPPTGLTPGFGSVTERRAAAELALLEREEWLAQQLSSQTAAHKSPQERIKIWEDLHGLDLPRAADHKLLLVIAMQTQLTPSEVRAEQLRRAGQTV